MLQQNLLRTTVHTHRKCLLLEGCAGCHCGITLESNRCSFKQCYRLSCPNLSFDMLRNQDLEVIIQNSRMRKGPWSSDSRALCSYAMVSSYVAATTTRHQTFTMCQPRSLVFYFFSSHLVLKTNLWESFKNQLYVGLTYVQQSASI